MLKDLENTISCLKKLLCIATKRNKYNKISLNEITYKNIWRDQKEFAVEWNMSVAAYFVFF